MNRLSSHVVLGPTFAVPVAHLDVGWETAEWYTALTVMPRVNDADRRQPVAVATAFIRNGWLHIPRFKGIELLGHLPADDRRSVGVPFQSVNFTGELRDDPPQREATSRVLSALHAQGGALLVLPCGFGKTVCALYVASTLGRRTLVLVHTGALADQWTERVRVFLPDARVGRIQQEVVDVDGCDVVIGMIQSLARREYARELLNTFGTVVVDEAHHIAAPWFSTALRKLNARHILGLSATPDRKDGLGRILPWMLGKIAFQAVRPQEHVHVRCIEYQDPPNQREMLDRRGKPRYSEMLTRLATNAERTRFLVQLIMQYVNEDSRRLIVLSERREQLLELERLLGAENGCVCVTDKKHARDTNTPARFTVGRVVGGTPASLRDRGFGATVLLSTYPYAAEGIDIPRLDTLIMASPGINIEQTIGRILREHPAKNTPLVVDVKDPFSLFNGMGWKRQHYYSSQNYVITHERYCTEKIIS